MTTIPNAMRTSDDVSTLNPTIFLQLQEEERQRLAHALMDGPGQILANALTEIEYSLPLLEKKPKVAITGLNALRNELRDGLARLQEYVAELQPPLLEEMGLGPSMKQYVKKFGERTGVQAHCYGCDSFNERYPITMEIALFRILQEALTNVQTHSRATRVRVDLVRHTGQVQMTIQDNGRGFMLRGNSAVQKRQLGLIAMRDRAELLRGQLQLFSEVGHGVRVVVTIPYHGHSSEVVTEGGQDHHEYVKHTVTRARSARPDTVNGQKKSRSHGRVRAK